MLSLQFVEALQSLLGYFLRILHDIPYRPFFFMLLITTAEFFSCHTPLGFSYLSFMHLFSHLTRLQMVTPRPCRCQVKHKGEVVATHVAVVSLSPLVEGLARWCRQSSGLGTRLYCILHSFPGAQSRISLCYAKQNSLIK